MFTARMNLTHRGSRLDSSFVYFTKRSYIQRSLYTPAEIGNKTGIEVIVKREGLFTITDPKVPLVFSKDVAMCLYDRGLDYFSVARGTDVEKVKNALNSILKYPVVKAAEHIEKEFGPHCFKIDDMTINFTWDQLSDVLLKQKNSTFYPFFSDFFSLYRFFSTSLSERIVRILFPSDLPLPKDMKKERLHRIEDSFPKLLELLPLDLQRKEDLLFEFNKALFWENQ